MKRTAWVLLWLSAGCVRTTLQQARPDAPPGEDLVTLVGSLRVVPAPLQRDTSSGGLAVLGEAEGHFYALFTPDLSEPWRSGTGSRLERYESVRVSFDGPFFIEIPRRPRWYLRGLTYATDTGWESLEVPVRVELGAEDRVVYVGALQVNRAPPLRVFSRPERDQAEAEAKRRGLTHLASAPWAVRLARPVIPLTPD